VSEEATGLRVMRGPGATEGEDCEGPDDWPVTHCNEAGTVDEGIAPIMRMSSGRAHHWAIHLCRSHSGI
jgi:hypothetical protein